MLLGCEWGRMGFCAADLNINKSKSFQRKILICQVCSMLKQGLRERIVCLRQEFLREATFLASLRDPNVSRVVALCSRDEPPCALQEFTEEGDLHAFLQLPRNSNLRWGRNHVWRGSIALTLVFAKDFFSFGVSGFANYPFSLVLQLWMPSLFGYPNSLRYEISRSARSCSSRFSSKVTRLFDSTTLHPNPCS